MIKQFVSSEFKFYSQMTWLTQFKSAMEMTETDPKQALEILLDTDLERWNIICNEIKDIEQVVEAIRFMGDMLGELQSICGSAGCRSILCKKTSYEEELEIEYKEKKIYDTIAVAKLAAWPRRRPKVRSYIFELNKEIQKLKLEAGVMDTDNKKLSKEIKNLDQKKDPTLHTNKITKIVAEEEKRREILDKIKKKIRARNVWVDLLTKAMKDNKR
jgi:hypothetical protein